MREASAKNRTRRYAILTALILTAFACFIYQYGKSQNSVPIIAASGITPNLDRHGQGKHPGDTQPIRDNRDAAQKEPNTSPMPTPLLLHLAIIVVLMFLLHSVFAAAPSLRGHTAR